MSTAAERPATDNPLAPAKSRRGRKRKARSSVEAVQRRVRQVVAAGVGVVFLLFVGSCIARALRPEKPAEPARAPVVVAGSFKLRDTDSPPQAPKSQPPGPEAPIFTPAPVDDAADDTPPPPKNEAPRPEPPPAPPPAAPAQPKADDPAPKPPAPPAAPPSSRAYKGPSEFELLKQIANMQDFGLTPLARQQMAAAYQTDYQATARLAMRPQAEPSTLLSYFPAAAQLPLRGASTCQLPPREADMLGHFSRKLHVYIDLIAPFDPATGKRKEPVKLREALRSERRGKKPEWLRPEAVPALVQILMHEEVPLRLMLVDLLSEIDGPAATIRLAQRAVFDLSPQVRDEAIAALRARPREPARPVWVNAFRYPWPRAAIHAAEALAVLKDDEIAPLLVAQLDKSDPALPYNTHDGKTWVRDVVRVDHISNCLLCHAPAFNGRDPVTGIDPVTIRPSSALENPNVRYPRQLLQGDRGNGIWANNLLIRADVQFVRQDFSVTFPVKPAFDLVQGRRVDFMVRTRQLKGEELREWKKQETSKSTSYPQRNSLLAALKAVTGRDLGPTAEAWAQVYPHAGAEAEGLRLSEALKKAPHEVIDRLVAKYRDSKDDAYTEGLARAIPHLGPKLQAKVREALIVRVTRLMVEQVRDRLGDDDDELRKAAAWACVRRLDPESIPDLISLLFAEDLKVVEGARKALQTLTDEDFFPSDATDPQARALAAARWQAWLRNDTEP